MGQTYGASLLARLPGDAVDTEDKQLTVLQSFFDTGVVLDLYEVVNDKVVRIHGPLGASVVQWVTDDIKIAEVRAAMRLGGSRPSSYFSFLDGFQLFVPDEEAHGPPIVLPLPGGGQFEFAYHNMVSGLARLRKINQRLAQRPDAHFEAMPHRRDEYVRFHEALIADIETCQRAGVVYALGT